MIAEIRGRLTAKAGDLVTVMTPAGIGYEIAIPLGVLERIPPLGSDVHLHTALVVREDGWALFGFDRSDERLVFQRLLLASGVGPRLALSLISALGGDRVIRAVREGDLAALCTVPGVGQKKAERMVLELKDRMRDLEVAEEHAPGGATAEQAVSALVNLGYGPAEADRAVRAAVAAKEDADASEVIRTALQNLAKA